MAAKLSIDLGDGNHPKNYIPIEVANEIWTGCMNAFVDLGLNEDYRPLGLIEVVRIYPNKGFCVLTRPEIVIEVVVSGAGEKFRDSKSVNGQRSPDSIRSEVREKIMSLTIDLSNRLRDRLQKRANHVARFCPHG